MSARTGRERRLLDDPTELKPGLRPGRRRPGLVDVWSAGDSACYLGC